MAAKASDLVAAGRAVTEVKIDGVEQPVEIIGMTVDQAIRFSELAKTTKEASQLYATLVKMCCPAFSGMFWWPDRIKKKLSKKVMLALALKIMEVSSYGSDGVDQEAKP